MFHHDSRENLLSLELLSGYDADVVLPGHGPVCGPEVFDETLDYLRFVQRVASQAHAAGVSPPDWQDITGPIWPFAPPPDQRLR